MIGLVDLDFQTSITLKQQPPNLEIMKLSNYYKTQQNKFCRMISLSQQQDLSAYQKIYIFSEQQKYPQIPKNFLQANNVQFGGTAFTNGKYIPFQNEIIEYTIPRIYLYTNILKEKLDQGINEKIIKSILQNSYYRMYAGKNKLPIPPMIANKRIYIYDIDFFYPDWKDIISSIAERRPSGIFCIHPIRCKTLTQYIQVRNISKLARANQIILDLNIPLNQIDYLFKNYKNMFLADVTTTSDVCLTLGGTFSTSSQYRRDLIYKLNLLYSFWSHGIRIRMRYDYPQVGHSNPLQNLEKRIVIWANNLTKKEKSIDEVISLKKKKSIQEEEKQYLLKFIPSAKDLFSQTLTTIQKGGVWRL